MVVYIAVVAGAYLLGSIPTGYLTGKARGVDIRAAGSGNIGATNTFRVMGKSAGIFVLAVDCLKGFVAVKFLAPAVPVWLGLARGEARADWLSLCAAAAVVMGHNYTCWLRFKGGKGVATSCGVLLALAPAAAAIVLSVWGIVLLASRYVSLASISAAFVLPVAAWLTQGSSVITAAATGLGALAIAKHRSNIQRLLAGTENRFGAKKDPVK
jgi:glycerol-3-phosphate acyltransferase PlsY